MVSCGFLVSGGDLPKVFEFVEVSLDKVSLPIDRRVDRALELAVALCGDMSAPAVSDDQIKDGAGVVATISNHVTRRRMGRKQIADGRLVRGLSRRQGNRHREAAMIHHRVDLGAQSATRTTDGVILAPLFPLAAC